MSEITIAKNFLKDLAMSNRPKPPQEFLNSMDSASAGTDVNRACAWLHTFAGGYKVIQSRNPKSGFLTVGTEKLQGKNHLARTEIPSESWLALLPSAVLRRVSISTGTGRWARAASRPHWFTFTDLVNHYFNAALLVGLDLLAEEVKDPDRLAMAWTHLRLFQEWPPGLLEETCHPNHTVGHHHWRWRNPLQPNAP